MNDRERLFADMHREHCDCHLSYEPVLFRMEYNGESYSYTPDFYCHNSLTFYEIVGSRQAFEQNKVKLNLFVSTYPQIKFEVINPDGTEYLARNLGARNARKRYIELTSIVSHRKDFEFRKSVKEKLIAACRVRWGLLTEIAREFKISAPVACAWTGTRLFGTETARRVSDYLESHDIEPRSRSDAYQRSGKHRTHCFKGHELSGHNVLSRGGCRACNLEAVKRYQIRKRERMQLTHATQHDSAAFPVLSDTAQLSQRHGSAHPEEGRETS